MIITGAFLGASTFTGIAILFSRLPRLIKKILLKHPLFSDLVGSVLAWLLICSVSNSLIALIASAVVALLISVAITIKNQKNLARSRK